MTKPTQHRHIKVGRSDVSEMPKGGHEELVHLHFKLLSNPARQEPCALCKPSHERTEGRVCSKCVIVVPRLDQKARRHVYRKLEPDQQRLFRNAFEIERDCAVANGTLRQRRKHAGMTQAELAEKIGVSQFHVSQLERGKKAPSAHLAQRIERLKC